MNEKGDESMKGEAYYSVRMRASENGPHEEGGKHISGGERLVPFIGLNDAVSDLLEKGMSNYAGQAGLYANSVRSCKRTDKACSTFAH